MKLMELIPRKAYSDEPKVVQTVDNQVSQSTTEIATIPPADESQPTLSEKTLIENTDINEITTDNCRNLDDAWKQRKGIESVGARQCEIDKKMMAD